MANEEIFNTPELRLRISELSYEDLKEAGYEKEIRRIYAEETGRELPANVTIIPSREVKNVKDESGYVGIAIHFHDEKKKINQVYVVSRGSQTMEDWLYNFFGILSGQDDSQYVNTRIFVDEVEKRAKKLAKGKEPLTIGLGHSQADNHHLNLRLAASDDVKLYFDKLYSVNGAQPNINLLWLIDDDFQWEVAKKFNVDHRDKNAIFTLPPVEVAKFAEEYYKNKKVDGISVTDNMVRYVSRNDPLYGVSIREAGFIDVGEMILIETNPDYPGLRDYVEQIPEEEIRKIQALFVEYRESYRNGGLQAVLREAIGIDLDLINELTDNPSSTISNRSGDLIAMIQSMREKFPNVLAAVAYIRKHADPVLSALVEGGYIEEAQKKEVTSELTGLEEDLQALYQVVEDLIASHEKLIEDIQEKNYFRGSWKTMLLPSEYINAVRKLVKIYKRASGRIDTFSELLKKLAPIEASHSVEEMLNALQRVKGKDEGLWKGYREGDMLYYKGGKGGEPIEVNISSAVRMRINPLKLDIHNYKLTLSLVLASFRQ
ncbi:DUF6792 domain-containing protein [Numidum massiliense]|uniref:DUF6792 domain-containing protein n=1 Tax=Numidum massiliense TaxID=1522315 RepID=UPI0006D5A5D1|nr:DUF6792 domain-containing protein [Numidum massiliense]